MLKSIVALAILTLGMALQATAFTDTSKKTVMAAATDPVDGYMSLAPNVVFPEVIDLSDNSETAIAYIEKFAEKRHDYLVRTYKRGKRFFDKVTKVLKRCNLPAELRVLLALESGFNANAVSSAGAVGYWQFMDDVAKEYGLKIVPQPDAETRKQMLKLSPDSLAKLRKAALKDERRNFNKSTFAAARYLKDRTRNLGNNWLLIVASYNWGIGNVWNAMERCGKVNPGFWDIKDLLPAETRNYVMNFIALNVIYHNYEKFASGNLRFRPVMARLLVPEQPGVAAGEGRK